MDVLKVNKYNLNLLEIFVSNLGDAALSFRYFAKRDISIVLKHEVTLLILLKGQPVAYGHLEKEKEIIWLGLCVLPNYQQLGFGKSMMKLLMQSAIDLDIKNISLSVDVDNILAIKLYEKFGFKRINYDKSEYYIYNLIINT